MKTTTTPLKTLQRLIAEQVVIRGVSRISKVHKWDISHVLRATNTDTSPPNANEKHMDETVMRSAQLIGVGNWMLDRVDERLRKLERELESEVRQDDPEKSGTERLFANAAKRVANAFDEIRQDVEDNLVKVCSIVGQDHAGSLKQHHGVASKPRTLEPDDMQVLGLKLGEHFKKLGDDLLVRFKAAIRLGLDNDDTVDQLVERIRGTSTPVKAYEPTMPDAGQDIPLSVKVLLFDGKRLLILKDAHSDWNDLPGGHVRAGETMGEAVQREVFEETGLKLTQANEIGAAGMTLGGKHVAVMFYSAPMPSGEVALSHEHEGYVMADAEAIAGLNVGVFRPVIETFLGVKVSDTKLVTASEPYVHAAAPLVLTVKSILDTTLNSFSLLIQNAISSAAKDIEEGLFDDLNDDNKEVLGFQWGCTLENTCPKCIIYDGCQWDADYQPIGDAPEYPGDPPGSMHPNCCCIVSVVNLQERAAPARGIDDHFRKQDPETLAASFGKAPARAFLEGELDGKGLLNSGFKLSPEAFARLRPQMETL